MERGTQGQRAERQRGRTEGKDRGARQRGGTEGMWERQRTDGQIKVKKLTFTYRNIPIAIKIDGYTSCHKHWNRTHRH
jgi:hypothetical protein